MLNKVFKFLFHRIVLVALSMLIQIGALVIVIWRFNEYFVYFYAFCVLLSLSAVLWIINSKSNPSYKIAWIVPILLVPIFGGIFFLLFGNNRLSRRERKKMAGIRERLDTCRLPKAMAGTPIALVMAGLMSLAFMGFKGMGH